MNQLFARKRNTYQTWTTTGKRIPVTILRTAGNVLVLTAADTATTLVGFEKLKEKHAAKPQTVSLKKMGVNFAVGALRKFTGSIEGKAAGEAILPSEVVTVGDLVKVTGISKGMGFAGGMKLHGFHGGPKTHGQSDRARAPGGSSSGTTLGRLFKNKRMAGRGGGKIVSVLNLQVVSVNDQNGEILVKGVVPGAMNGRVTITKTCAGKFEGLLQPTSTASASTTETQTAEPTTTSEVPVLEPVLDPATEVAESPAPAKVVTE